MMSSTKSTFFDERCGYRKRKRQNKKNKKRRRGNYTATTSRRNQNDYDNDDDDDDHRGRGLVPHRLSHADGHWAGSAQEQHGGQLACIQETADGNALSVLEFGIAQGAGKNNNNNGGGSTVLTVRHGIRGRHKRHILESLIRRNNNIGHQNVAVFAGACRTGARMCGTRKQLFKTQRSKTKQTTMAEEEEGDDEQQLFFGRAIDRLNGMTLLPSSSSTMTPDDIRRRIVQTQRDTPGYEQVQESLRRSSRTKTPASDRLDQTARVTYARLILEASCRNVLTVPPRQRGSGEMIMDEAGWLEFFALCRAAVQIATVRDHLRNGTPLFGVVVVSDDDGDSDRHRLLLLPHERWVRVQRHYLRALGIVDMEGAMEYIRRRFIIMDDGRGNNAIVFDDDQASDDPLMGPFRAMVHDLRAALLEEAETTTTASRSGVTGVWSNDDNDDGTTRIISVHHCEKLIDAATGREIMTFPPSGQNVDGEPSDVPTTEQMYRHHHAEEDENDNAGTISSNKNDIFVDSPLLAQAWQVQQQMRTELLRMDETDRTALLDRAAAVTTAVLRDVVALNDPMDRIRYLSTLDGETQRLMALHKIGQDVVTDGGGPDGP